MRNTCFWFCTSSGLPFLSVVQGLFFSYKNTCIFSLQISFEFVLRLTWFTTFLQIFREQICYKIAEKSHLIFLILINSDQFFSQKIQWFSVSHISCTSKKSLKYCQLWILISRRAHQSVVKTKQIPFQWYNHKFNFGKNSRTAQGQNSIFSS